MINSHIFDGVALTKFIYWIKNVNKKKFLNLMHKINLEKFRKKSKDYLYPSFNTIAGSGLMEQLFIIEHQKKKQRS